MRKPMIRRFEFPRDERAPAQARRALAAIDPALGPGVLGDAQLLISELVTNSVQHGAGDSVVLLVDPDAPGTLRCEVVDDGHGFTPRARPAQDVGGWGLELVEQIGTAWGVREGSTHVWFELPTDQP